MYVFCSPISITDKTYNLAGEILLDILHIPCYDSGNVKLENCGDLMKNIVLIGMPGTGKSVVGQVLARHLQYAFVDVDDLIAETSGKTLPEILRTEGLEAFLTIEEQVGLSVTLENTVIATGGSMVLSDVAMMHLKENGVVVWLETPLSKISDRMPEDLVDRGIAAPAGMTIREIYRHRQPLYAQYADLIVVSQDDLEGTAYQVEEMMRTVGVSL